MAAGTAEPTLYQRLRQNLDTGEAQAMLRAA